MQIANVLEKGFVPFMVMRLVLTPRVPVINLALQLVPTVKKSLVFWAHCLDQLGEAGPKLLGRNSAAGKSMIIQKPNETFIHLQAVFINALSHRSILPYAVFWHASVCSNRHLGQKFPIGNKPRQISGPTPEVMTCSGQWL